MKFKKYVETLQPGEAESLKDSLGPWLRFAEEIDEVYNTVEINIGLEETHLLDLRYDDEGNLVVKRSGRGISVPVQYRDREMLGITREGLPTVEEVESSSWFQNLKTLLGFEAWVEGIYQDVSYYGDGSDEILVPYVFLKEA